MPVNFSPTVVPGSWTPTNSSTVCNGPIGANIVVSMVTGNGPAGTASSLCTRTTMTNLWWWENRTITITSTDAPRLNVHTWLFTPTTGGSGPLEGLLFTPPQPRPRVLPTIIRAGRRAVRRSIDIYARFRGMDEIRRFVQGEPIVYEGVFFNYRVQKTNRILPQTMNPGATHIPYSLCLVSKTTGKVGSSGCVVFPHLPVIDQLLALTFHLQDPEEEQKLIAMTNWNPRLPTNWRQQVMALQEAA